ncbi:MAG: GNAT family N-acetyltransferase [Planctomycetota bacterium]
MIEYRTHAEGVTPEQLSGFFDGWPQAPSRESHLQILQRSSEVVLAFDTESSRVVGFITAISDGFLAAYIPLLEVLPSHRGQGVGAELVRRMLDRLSTIYMVDLVCDPELVPYYEKLGLSHLAGMAKRNPRALSALA